MSKKDFNIFYSWQSDTDPRYNNHFIKDCLERVVKELSKDSTLKVIPSLERDVKGDPGSPNIVEAIFRKIDGCQIIVADVTLINNNLINRLLKTKLTPNPNVLIELGYGLNRLSWERIICLNNSYFSKVERLPFDLKQNRISQYRYGSGVSKEKPKKGLTELLKRAVREIIDKYDVIEEKSKASNISTHDKKVFVELDKIIKDDQFINLLQCIGNNQLLSRQDYRHFDQIEEFLKADRNKFLTPEIELSATKFRESLTSMHMTFAKNFHSRYETWIDENGAEQNETTYTFSEEINYQIKEKKTDENMEAIGNTIKDYRNFRKTIKAYLLV